MEIQVEELLIATVDEVWEAITVPEQMKQWYFEEIPDFKPEVGFKTRFRIEANGRSFTHIWEVTKVVPMQEIAYNWSYEEYFGMGSVSFKLNSNGEKTRLTLTNKGLETFPQENPEFSEESCRGGWEYFIKGNLPKFLQH
ncbi:MAG: SRPBCC domain-containing protein [Bacteroidales bacterium]